MKKDAFYFSHDYNAANDVKCLFLRQQLGMEGYGIFWYLIEALANSGGSMPLAITPVLAMQMQVPEIKVQAVITKFNLFDVTESEFSSPRLSDHLSKRKFLSDKGREGILKRWNKPQIPIFETPAAIEENSHPINLPNSNPYTKERKGKEKKGKEIKLKESKIPDFNEFLEYAILNKSDVNIQAVELKYKAWKESGWASGTRKIVNWKTTLLNTLPYIKTADNKTGTTPQERTLAAFQNSLKTLNDELNGN